MVTWHGLSAWPWVAPGWLVLSAGAVWSYRRRLLPAVCRVLAITALATAALRPAVRRAATAAERGPVVFLIDDSASMSIVDNGRPAAQWVAVTAALGRLPAGTRDDQTVTLQRDCDRLAALADDVARSKAAVDYAALAGRDGETAQSRLDQSLRELHEAAKATAGKAAGVDGAGQLTKTLGQLSTAGDGPPDVRELARSAATAAEAARLATDGRLFRSNSAVRAACGPVSVLSRIDLAETAVFDPVHGLLANLPTDQRRAVYTVGDRLTPTTGGRLTAGGTATAFTDAVRTILDNPVDPPRAVVVLSDGRQTTGPEPSGGIGGPDRVPVFTVAVGARVPPRDLSVSTVTVPSTAYIGVAFKVTVQLKSVGLGTSRSTLRVVDQVRPVTVADDKPTTEVFTVTPTTAGPMAIDIALDAVVNEATAGNNRVRRWLKVFDHRTRVAVVGTSEDWAQTRLGLLDWLGWPLQRPPVAAEAATPGTDADVIVVFDGGRSLTPVEMDAIDRAVVDRGASLIVVPAEEPGGPSWPYAPPARAWRHWPDRRPGFRATPVGDTILDPPPFGRYTPAPTGRPLLVESETDIPVVVDRPAGRGRVLTVCIGDFNADPTRFWADLIRLAADDPYLATTDAGSIDVDPVWAKPGAPIAVRARAGSRTCSLQITQDGNVVRSISMTPADGRFTATVDDLPIGRYEFSAGATVPVTIESTTERELANLSSDEPTLQKLAESTGGRFYRLDQLESLSKKLAELPDTSPSVEKPLWDTSVVVAVVVGGLILEWAMRKRAGMV